MACAAPTVEFSDGVKPASRGSVPVMHWDIGGGSVDGQQYLKPMNVWLPENSQCGGKIDILYSCYNTKYCGGRQWHCVIGHAFIFTGMALGPRKGGMGLD